MGTEPRNTFSGGNRANYYEVFLLGGTKTIFLHAKLKNPNRRASCVNTVRSTFIKEDLLERSERFTAKYLRDKTSLQVCV